MGGDATVGRVRPVVADRCADAGAAGTDDRVVAPGNVELLGGRIPGAELQLLEGAGHVFWSEQPELADRLILDFIERHRDA